MAVTDVRICIHRAAVRSGRDRIKERRQASRNLCLLEDIVNEAREAEGVTAATSP